MQPAISFSTRSHPNHALHLPAFATHFVGRQTELQTVMMQLETHALVSIIGPGGMGKTRLAAQVLSELAPSFVNSAWFIALAPVTTTDLLIAAISRALGLELKEIDPTGRSLLAYLADKSLLLVLDNFEQLLDAVAFISAVGAQAPRVKLLITSRERLGIPAEAAVELRGLPVAASEAIELEAAERLFVQVAQVAKPAFKPSDDELTHIRRVCALANGMPLAIELAAAWVTLLPVRFIADQIQHNLDWLTTSTAITHSPQKSVRAVFDYFWNLLSANEQRCLRQLSVFRGGFERGMAQQVAGASLFFLSALVDRAFLSRSPAGRYLLHELLQQYAAEQLRKHPGEEAAAFRRHAQAILALARQAASDSLSPDHPEWQAQMEAELANIRAALGWALQAGERELALQLVTRLERFWDRHSRFAEACRWARAALDLPGSASAAQMQAFLLVGRFQESLGNFDIAHQHLVTAIAQADALDDLSAKASALSVLSVVNYREGHFEAATQIGQQAVMLAKSLDDRPAMTLALRCYAMAISASGSLTEAIDLIGQSLAIARELNDLRGVTACLNGLGINLAALGQHASSKQHLQESLAINQQLGDRDKAAINLLNLGWVSHLQNNEPAAEIYHHQALALFREIGRQESATLALMNLGDSMLARGAALSDVAQQYLEALTTAARINAMPMVMFALINAAHISSLQGDLEQATIWLGLILHHPSANNTAHTNAQMQVEKLRSLLPADALEHLLAKGAASDLNEAVINAQAFLQSVVSG